MQRVMSWAATIRNRRYGHLVAARALMITRNGWPVYGSYFSPPCGTPAPFARFSAVITNSGDVAPKGSPFQPPSTRRHGEPCRQETFFELFHRAKRERLRDHHVLTCLGPNIVISMRIPRNGGEPRAPLRSPQHDAYLRKFRSRACLSGQRRYCNITLQI